MQFLPQWQLIVNFTYFFQELNFGYAISLFCILFLGFELKIFLAQPPQWGFSYVPLCLAKHFIFIFVRNNGNEYKT
jgi:hypothetical protein